MKNGMRYMVTETELPHLCLGKSIAAILPAYTWEDSSYT